MPEFLRRDILRTAACLSAGSLLSGSSLDGVGALASAVSNASTKKSFGQVTLGAAAESVFDYLITNCTCDPPRSAFWRNPHDTGLSPDQNGWQGAQAIQSAIINYEATHQQTFLRVVRDFSDWIEHTYSGRDHLTLCETWPVWDMVQSQFRDFRARVIRAADAFARPYPEGYAEQAGNGPGTVVMEIFDCNVSGFGCFWWTKYIVPLNPKQYGGVIIRTAREIVTDQGIHNVSSPCWNSLNCTPENSRSEFGKDPK